MSLLARSEPSVAIEFATFGDALAARAAGVREATAFTFLADGELEEETITYGALHERALAIAGRLRETVRPGGRALLLFAPGLDYVAALFGCFYASVVAVSSYPPQPKRLERTLERLLAIAEDAGIEVVLTVSAIRDAAALLPADNPLSRAAWIATDGEALEVSAWERDECVSEDLAFLQYTSGSTAAPRGVALTHRNLIVNSEAIARAFGHSSESRGLIWLPPYHDMGLIGGVLQPIYRGFPCVLLSPLAVIKRPARWLEAVSRHHATVSGGPDFAYDLCVHKIDPELRDSLDLSTWEVAFNGAEPVRARTIEAFSDTFAPCGFRKSAFMPCYGLAEATLMVTAEGLREPPVIERFDARELEGGRLVHTTAATGRSTTLVGCGEPVSGHAIEIVHPELRLRCETEQVGEIWISGPSVASGYWSHERETEETFGARLADDPVRGPFLRTGDLGVLRDGELFVVGRLKEVLILRGRNYFPHEIEEAAEGADRRLRRHSSAAFTLIEESGEPYLAIVAEVVDGTESCELEETIAVARGCVADAFDLQTKMIALCRAGSVPKTTSGKIQRSLCRSLLLDGKLDVVAQWRPRAIT
jgi:acyl-CoA synthetase (AMP-forming)/AMP-acid ligase II